MQTSGIVFEDIKTHIHTYLANQSNMHVFMIIVRQSSEIW